MTTILIVDDHPVIRLAVRVVLEREGYVVAGEADAGVEALRQVRELQPDLVILDVGIPRLDGLEVMGRLLTMDDPPRVLVLTAQGAAGIAGRCLQAGASGFVCKQTDLHELVGAVKAVMSGYSYFPNLALHAIRAGKDGLGEDAAVRRLSDRELAVLQQLAAGLSNKQIAQAMILSPKTISTYKARLLEKLSVKTLVQLVDIAKRQGLA